MNTGEDSIPLAGLKPARPPAQVEIRHASLKSHLGMVVLDDVSLYLQPGEMVVLTGPDTQPLTNLLKLLAGMSLLKGSVVLMDGLDLAAHHKALRPLIGYSAPESVLPPEDTVQELFWHTVKLAVPRGVPSAERKKRLAAITRSYSLEPYLETRVRSLPLHIQRLVQIACEAIRTPTLLLVDEPAVGTDAYSDLVAARILQQVTRKQGMTVVMVSRTPAVIKMADKVAVLAPEGEMAWFGPPDEAVDYFRSSVPGEQAGPGNLGWESILELVGEGAHPEAAKWSKRYQAQPAFQQYSMNPRSADRPDLLLEDQPLNRLRGMQEEARPPQVETLSSAVSQIFPLAARTVRSILRSPLVFLAFLAPFLAGGLDLLIASQDMLDAQSGDPLRAGASLGFMVLFAMLIPALLFSQLLGPEIAGIKHNRRLYLKLPALVLSKTLAAALFALYQGLVLTGFHFLSSGGFASPQNLLILFGSLFLLSIIGGLLGLLASTIVPSAAMAAGLAVALVLPQVILGGVLTPLPGSNMAGLGTSQGISQEISLAIPARYGFEALITASGFGNSLASDACWNLSPDQRIGLTDAQKQSCGCMGANIFSQCDFPGVHAAFSPALEQPEPQAPNLNNSLLPVQPAARQGQTLEEYASEVSGYTLELEKYQGSLDAFISNLRQYASNLATWQRDRSLAIGRAEGQLSQAFTRFGPFIGVSLLADWIALSVFLILLTVLLTVILIRKGAN